MTTVEELAQGMFTLRAESEAQNILQQQHDSNSSSSS